MSDLDDNPVLKLQPLKAGAVDMFFQALSPLKEYLDAPDTAEIMVNDHRNVWVEHRGVMSRVNVDLRPEHLEGAIHSLASSVDKSARAGSDKGIINAGHKNLRIAAVMNPTAIDGHALSIRKHRESKMSLDDYVRMGAFAKANAKPEEAEAIHFEDGIENEALMRALTALVQSRKNVLVAGGTSAGKTTFLNALVSVIPDDQRVITIEDTMELKVQVPNRVRLLSNADTNVTTQLLVALCLRFRPDRIIVGEVRGGEGYDLLQALNTGHDGGLASLHANNARTALSRLESLAMLGIPTGSRWELADMRKNIADCFNYVVHFKRTGELRHVSEILEIRGFRNNDYDLRRVF
ncbi:type II secretion system protein E [Paraburkholderia hospita]|uniref:Type II secretion system protein E n=1 Tax=Paraburkholderia hospita TaxID=169430 RepID=A0ABP2PLM3_9BURK|nr:ATPase, T2SS/T4P/T4SS family [Paraburkholderia hospita]EIM98702.1 type II secretion system protein E [Paraburkholderia hospita]OUL87858.1 conjugal transfer protein TrbB [Paraburkholderia hospita]